MNRRKTFPSSPFSYAPHLLKTGLDLLARGKKADDYLHPVETRWVDKVVECNINLFVEYESFHQTNKWDNVNKWCNERTTENMKDFTSYCAGFVVETWDVWVGVTCWDCKNRDRKRRVECLRKHAFTILWKLYCCHQINNYRTHYYPWPSRYH